MSRPIKFRAKSIEPLVGDDQWVYGFGVHVVKLSDGGEEYWLYTESGTYQVDPETVGQYTGNDDKSDKELYEGDILERGGNTYLVLFDEHSFLWKQIHDSWLGWNVSRENRRSWLSESFANKSMKIGNCFDHPYLLGDDKQ